MLRGVALEFARRGWDVSVVGRRARRLAALTTEAEGMAGRVVPLATDYTRAEEFLGHVRARCTELGAPEVTVAWIHKTAPEAPLRVAQEIARSADGAAVDYVHVLSRLRTPDARDRTVPNPTPDEADLRALPTLTYRKAILGWVVEGSRSRWLTDDEIAGGVIGAIDTGAPITPIGQIDPLDSNPTAHG